MKHGIEYMKVMMEHGEDELFKPVPVKSPTNEEFEAMREDLRWMAARYAGVIDPSRLAQFQSICKRWNV